MDQRIRHTRKRLELDVDAWAGGQRPGSSLADPLVFSPAPRPSFLRHHDRLLFAAHADSPTVKNALVSRVRVALDGVRDVVIIDGQAEPASSAALSSDEIQASLNMHGSDPRTWADTVISLAPMRIQAWREENEIAGRTVTRNGAWVSGPCC